MPWLTPTLKDVRKQTRDYVLTQLGARAMVPNSVLRIMSDSMSGLAHLNLLYLDWLSKQQLPDTAEQEWLDRHGNIWLKNSDGSTGRKAATYAQGQVMFTGTPGIIVPAGTVLTGSNDVQYQTTQDAPIGAIGGWSIAVALTAGIVGNLPEDDTLGSNPPLDGVDNITLSTEMTGGVDTETDEQLRERVLRRIQQPPMGGCAYDYEQWTLAVPGVTRAWCGPLEMGIGTATVRFMCDDLRASNAGFPLYQDIQRVIAYLDSVRPVTVEDLFVVSPIPQHIDFHILDLQPATPNVIAEIETSIKEMLFEQAAPGETIYVAHKYGAILDAPGVRSFTLTNNTDDVMPSPGHMATLGTIFYTPPIAGQASG